MHEAIVLIGFLGAWLLFAGPIYQAALELIEEDVERDRIRSMTQDIQSPPKISPLWWLVPPIKILLEQRRSRKYRKTYMKALLPEDVEALVTFTNKATGWLMVALGGLLIAIKETFELKELFEISTAWFIAIVLIAGFLSILYTVIQIIRSKDIISASKN